MLTRRELLGTSASLLVACSARISTERRVVRTLAGLPTTDGAGVKLTRVIGQPVLRNLDPFLMLDRFHSDDPGAYLRGFPDHPHRGFETVTVMLNGRMRHKDNRGNSGLIRDGGVQWMTAGRGIVHSEMPEQTGGLMSGFQMWLNLPAREKMRTQEYQDLQRDRLSHVMLSSGGAAHVIAGHALDAAGPVAPRSTQPLLVTAELEDERPLDVATPFSHTAFVFVHQGAVRIGDARLKAGTLAVLSEGSRLCLHADGMPSGVLIAAAKPLHEPIVQSGPFVMNSAAEIQRAFADYHAGVL